MNRDRKQRFWDGERFRFPEYYEIGTNRYFDTFRDLENNTPIKNLVVSDPTGLTDKNGKEIYEGDILSGIFSIKTGERTSTYKRQKSTFGVYSDLQILGTCCFIGGCWYFKSDFKVEYNTGFYAGLGSTTAEKKANESVKTYSHANEILSKVLSKIEIVGNIHSNPELLNQ